MLFIYFSEREEEKKKEREKKYQCVVAPHMTPTGDLSRNPGMCLTGNGTSDPLVHRPVLNPLSHTSQGRN